MTPAGVNQVNLTNDQADLWLIFAVSCRPIVYLLLEFEREVKYITTYEFAGVAFKVDIKTRAHVKQRLSRYCITTVSMVLRYQPSI